jgi:hypothetical protein
MNGFVKTRELCAALGSARKSVLERAEREGWPCMRKAGGILWVERSLPMDVRLALARSPASVRAEVEKTVPALAGHGYIRATEKERETAALRASLIAEWQRSGLRKEDFVEAYNAGEAGRAIRENLGRVSLRTFYRWLAGFSFRGASGITPRYSAAAKGGGGSLSETEKTLLEHFWLKDTRPTVTHALMLMRENVPYSECSYQTALRYLKSLPQPLIDYHRLGKTAFINLHQPFMDQNIGQYKSLDVVVSDHHCLDCVVMYRGKLIRPWVTTMQDYRSGKILGWCPSISPSSLSIIASYYMAVIQYGVPRKLLFDNGRDYRSEILNGKYVSAKVFTPQRLEEQKEVYIQGLFYLIGSQVGFTQAYNGKSKGRQERYFKTLKEYVAKDTGGYIGGDSRERPEDSELYFRAVNKRAKRHDVPCWQNIVEALAVMIPYINDKFTSQGKGMDGKTASAVFDENLPPDVRRADKDTLRMALSKGELRKVSHTTVKMGNVSYYHPDLFVYSGREVIVRQKLTTDAQVAVCDLDGRFVCNAAADYFFEGEDLAESTKRLRGAQKLNLTRLAELGTGEAKAAPEYETMIDVARNKYSQAELVDVDEYLALPQAAGAETAPEVPASEKPKRKIKSILDAKPEDYL